MTLNAEVGAPRHPCPPLRAPVQTFSGTWGGCWGGCTTQGSQSPHPTPLHHNPPPSAQFTSHQTSRQSSGLLHGAGCPKPLYRWQ